MKLQFIHICLILIVSTHSCSSQNETDLLVGAEQPEKYISLLKGKKVGVVVNHTSRLHEVHLVDFLIQNEIKIQNIYAPEHGFRGDAARGVEFDDEIDTKTGIPLVSIYGKSKKPSPQQLEGIDVIVFDIQDVGCRFYTYISTLFYIVEACAENNIPLLVLDRPNPNGEYVAGPIRKKGLVSFVSLLPVPVVHGCTIGEMAIMINGERWHSAKNKCDITVIPIKAYSHLIQYEPPILPSPNLPNLKAIKLYPFLCFFEATSVSIGRGTTSPFQVIGYPDENFGAFSFTPNEISGVAVAPLHEGEKCYGEDLNSVESCPDYLLDYFLKYYKKFPEEKDFLTRERWFNLLIGDEKVLTLIREGKTIEEINESWKNELDEYKRIRKKYILYPDFE